MINTNYGNHYGYTGLKTNNSQYKKVEQEKLAALMEEEAAMTPEQKMLYELLGGRKAHMKNVMSQYNSDGDFTAGGIVVPGMDSTGIPESERHQIINISEDARQNMFENCKREFLAEYGVANGDTTKRSSVYRAFQLSIKKEDRLKGTWTLQQYETAYNQAFYDAIKAADPNWEIGKSFNKSILDSVTRESVDNALVKQGNRLVLPRKSLNISV